MTRLPTIVTMPVHTKSETSWKSQSLQVLFFFFGISWCDPSPKHWFYCA